MIDQLKGIVEQKTLKYAVLFVKGVGYKLTMSINGLESLPPKGKEAQYLSIGASARIYAIQTSYYRPYPELGYKTFKIFRMLPR